MKNLWVKWRDRNKNIWRLLLVYEDVEEPENCLYKIENNQLIEIGQPTKIGKYMQTI